MTDDAPGEGDFWEQPELVERFARRDPDVRLMRLLERYDDPGRVRVLDLGCAGGRNTVPLAERGFDVHAVDSSRAMVERTRARLAPIWGTARASARAAVGKMDDLGAFEDGFFQLVLGLGVYHQAGSPAEWERAIEETSRVLEIGGLLLYASFDPESAPDGSRGVPIPGQLRMYRGFRSGTAYLISGEELEQELASRQLVPDVATDTVRVATDHGVRVTVNALFRRTAAD